LKYGVILFIKLEQQQKKEHAEISIVNVDKEPVANNNNNNNKYAA